MNGHDHATKPHFILIPLLAQGHIIPMLDMAHLLAGRGVLISFITTPINAARIEHVIDCVRTSSLPIRFIVFDFPCTQYGLPEGCENIDLIVSAPEEHGLPFFNALSLLQKPLEDYIRGLELRPTCIISDSCQWWSVETARELEIPRLVFHGPSCFYLLTCHNIRKHGVYDKVEDEFEPVIVPELPDRIQVTKAQEPGSWFEIPGWEKMREKVFYAEKTADGVVVNSFRELEPEYIECYQKAIGKTVLPIGPLSLYSKDAMNQATRGNKASIDGHQIFKWLDTKEKISVLYVSFGSIAKKCPPQLIELGCGLEETERPFIWVLKEDENCGEMHEWLTDFTERTKERGLVITGWAPQVVILSHPAIGAFMTHCGWNSILEATTMGLPMVTWPCFADQFVNERLVVDVLRIGVGVGVTIPSYGVDEVLVKRFDVEKAVRRLMGGGEEGEGMRKRAGEIGEKARKAMEEGGSSYEDLSFLIKYVAKLSN